MHTVQVICLKESKKLLDYLAQEFGKDYGSDSVQMPTPCL